MPIKPIVRPTASGVPVPDANAALAESPSGADIDRDSFASVVREHADRLYAFCFRLAGNAADAEDLDRKSVV